MALLSFSFLELEKWFQTSSYSFLPSLENSDHTTKSADTWMNWTACQCYSRKKRGGELINCTTEYEFIYTEKMRILLNESNMKRKCLCSGTSYQYLNSQLFRISFLNIKRKQIQYGYSSKGSGTENIRHPCSSYKVCMSPPCCRHRTN